MLIFCCKERNLEKDIPDLYIVIFPVFKMMKICLLILNKFMFRYLHFNNDESTIYWSVNIYNID